jgi:hypothetical protein
MKLSTLIHTAAAILTTPIHWQDMMLGAMVVVLITLIAAIVYGLLSLIIGTPSIIFVVALALLFSYLLAKYMNWKIVKNGGKL